MVDSEWLKNLAHASIKDGRLTAVDQTQVRRLQESRVRAAIAALEDEAREAAEVHNNFGKRHVRVLSLTAIPPAATFTLLLGKAQITLSYRPYIMTATLAGIKAFQRASKEIMNLVPEADAFGTVHWRTDTGLLMNNELIVKKLFEDLTRAALELAQNSTEIP